MSSTRASRPSGLRGAALLLLAGALVVRPAAAQPAPGDAAMAETLFEDGKKLMASGDFAAACPKLAESNRLDPGSGTLTALALCHEQQGKTATAWAEFIELVTGAHQAGRTDREKFARQHVAALEPTLSRLTITVAAETSGLADLVVRRDKVAVGPAAWGVAAPLDPGEHVIEAAAPGKQPWSAHVTLGRSGDTRSILIPALEEAPVAPEAPSPVFQAPAKEAVEVPHANSQRTIALVVGGVGVAALAVGSYFGVQALSKSSDAKKLCSASSCTDPSAVQMNDDAKSDARVADVVMGGGLVAIGVGAYLFFSAPHQPTSATGLRVMPMLSRGGAGASMLATF